MKMMRKKAGFTMIELLVAMAITMVVLGAAVMAFRDSTKANKSVTQKSDMSDNVRAGLNLIVQDLIQTGTGIPTGGISIPNSVDANGCNQGLPVNRPPAILGKVFDGPNAVSKGCNVILPAIEPGPDMGPTVTSPDGTSGPKSDIIMMMYADNTLQKLSQKPVNGPTCPNGSINPSGSTFIFDQACVVIGAAGIPVNPGDLLMIFNNNGNCLQTVSAVGGQTLTFNPNDAFNLNGRSAKDTAGTIKQLQNPDGSYPPTSVTRVWMVTYYLDSVTDPLHPTLMREVNFNAPQPVAESLENLQFAYNFADGSKTPPVNQFAVPAADTENQIRSVNIYLGARSEARNSDMKYVRTNLSTQVALRSMAYFNTYK
jgi:prepilin-type N-terminal cleavage/methylation domain-containing protein